MSKLDDLIKELCPNGVSYKNLDEVTAYSKETVDVSNFNEDTYVSVENLLPNKQGKTQATSIPTKGKAIQFKVGDILIGNIRPYLRKIWLATCNGGTNGDVLTIQIKDKTQLLPRFLFYILSSEDFFIYDTQFSKGAKMPRGNKNAVMKYRIPIPPLPIQTRIITILDAFTELTARKKQYEYYRDNLLTFPGCDRIEQKTLGEICHISAGGDVSKDALSKEKTDEYTIPVISNGVGSNALYGYTDVPKITQPAVTVAARGTIGYAEYRDYPYFPIIRLLSAIPKDVTTLNTKYLYYCLQGKNYKVPTGGIPQLTAPELKKTVIPVPPLDVQERLVNVLDNFDAICSDLNIGLPAEIEARQKQYEYYRDILLTFPECGRIETDRQTELNIIKLRQYVFGYSSVTLDMISENHDSKRKPVTSGKREAGEYPYYGASGIVDYVSSYIFDGDYLLVSEDGNNLVARNTPIAFSISGKNWVNNHAHVLKFDCYATRRYVEFYLNSIDLSPYISGGAQPKLNQKNLNNIPILLPPIEEQERIVNILDRFDKLCNDISEGLPAEIEARQKQYEYYRDKLLTFKQNN